MPEAPSSAARPAAARPVGGATPADGPSVTCVDVHIDVMCPFAYQSSRWLREVRDRLGVEVRWRFFSLEEVNRRDGKKHPWERDWSYGWSMMRIGAFLRRDPGGDGSRGDERVDRWYEQAGRALHVDGRKPHVPDVARELLAEIDEDPAIVDLAIADPSTHDDIHADHQRVLGANGYGVPTMFFPEHGDECLFGPVLVDPPTGAAAERLWRAVTAWVEFPLVFELQRPKSADHLAAISDTLRPYVEARDWVSIDRGRVIPLDRPPDPASPRPN